MSTLHTKGGTRTHRPYLVWSYDYSHASAGPKALHRLCHELNEAGERAYIGAGWATNPEWNTPTHEPFEGDWIAVYPEIVSGNPWNAPHVARWVLNVPGLLGGDKVYDPTEHVFTWAEQFLAGVPILQPPTIDTAVYFDRHETRSGTLGWVGKGDRGRLPPGIPEITMEMRLDGPTLAAALNRAEVLYSLDPVSGMNHLALLCGCPVDVAPTGERLEPDGILEKYHAIEAAFPEQLRRFVRVTQATSPICAVIPTRFHPPELDPLLAVLREDGVCIHLIIDPDDSEHRIYAMWNKGADEARAHGARYIAILNDDITLLPGTLPLFARAFAQYEARRRPFDRRLGLVHPDMNAPWHLPDEARVEVSPVLTGCCFVFRADVGIRFDESYHWWYGDNQFDDDLRAAGWLVARVAGVPYKHRPETSTRAAWDYLGPLTAIDRDLYDRRHPPKPSANVPTGLGSSYP